MPANDTQRRKRKTKQDDGWFLPTVECETPCGCVYSILGDRLYACPEHEHEDAGERMSHD